MRSQLRDHEHGAFFTANVQIAMHQVQGTSPVQGKESKTKLCSLEKKACPKPERTCRKAEGNEMNTAKCECRLVSSAIACCQCQHHF